MPIKLRWTDATDTSIRRLRAEGASWDAIAAAIGTSRWSAIERGRHIGARAPVHVAAPPPDPGREALPAGHPLTWGAITDGTLLADTRYPWPPLPLIRAEKLPAGEHRPVADQPIPGALAGQHHG